TMFVLTTQIQRDRFDYSTLRDADSIVVKPGIELKPFALITGSAHVGYRRFRLVAENVPAFAGLVSGVDLSYQLLGDTRITIQMQRDVDFSFELNEPYYVRRGIGSEVERRLMGGWGIIGRIDNQRLTYRVSPNIALTGSPRVDVIDRYLGSVGYRFGP